MRRREAILAGIGRELQGNRSAARGALDAFNAHYMVARLATVAFERYGCRVGNDRPGGRARIQALLEGRYHTGRHPHRRGNARPGEDENLRRQWIGLASQASVEVSNPATLALKTLGLQLESEEGTDSPDEQ